jgi:hypothetical protein
MKYTKTTMTLIFSACLATHAFAQGGSSGMGGGGDILLDCVRQPSVTQNFLLDIIEKEGFRPHTGNGRDLSSRLEYVLARFGRVDPSRANRYAKMLKQMLEDLKLIRSGRSEDAVLLKKALLELNDIDDSDEIYNYRALGCASKRQLARQEFNLETGKIQFILDLDLFERLDLDNQVATLLHEVIYYEFRADGAVTSRAAREMNRLVLSQEMATIPVCRYHEKIKLWGLKEYLLLGSTRLQEGRFTCSESGELTEVRELYLPFEAYGVERSSELLSMLANQNPSFWLLSAKMKGPEFVAAKTVSHEIAFKMAQVGDQLQRENDASKKESLAPGRWFQARFESGGLIRWSGLQIRHKKRLTDDLVTVLTDTNLKVIDVIRGDGVSVNVMAKSLLEQFVNRAIALRKAETLTVSRLLQIVAWLRQELATNRETSISTALQMLEDPSRVIPQVLDFDVSSFDPKGSAWVQNLLNGKVRECHVTSTQVAISGLVGLRLGGMSLECEHWNGEVSRYRSKVLFPFSFGIGFFVGRVITADIHIEGITEQSVVLRDDFFTAALGFYSPYVGNKIQGAGLAMIGGLNEFSSVKFKKKSQRYDVTTLTRQLLTSIPVKRP